MRVRVLQRRNDDDTWFDDAYAYEKDAGQVGFRYNLTWEQIGARCEVKIRETVTSLEEIETVIPTNPGLRWLPIEEIANDQADAYLEKLDTACRIPKPKKVPIAAAA